jgi:alkylhydroperoxidase/carboxymuconolactone decarboxylase family protein YurZ
MRRTKLIYATGKESDIEKQMEKALHQYSINKEDIIEIKYSQGPSTMTALIVYEHQPQKTKE